MNSLYDQQLIHYYEIKAPLNPLGNIIILLKFDCLVSKVLT